MYYQGLGVPQDYVQAYMWFKISQNYSSKLDDITKKMTPPQLMKAEELVRIYGLRLQVKQKLEEKRSKDLEELLK